MSNIETLTAQRQALEAQIEQTRKALEAETAAKRNEAIEQCRALAVQFGLKAYEITGGAVPGRKAKVIASSANPAPTLQAPETPQEGTSKGPATPEAAPQSETPAKPAKVARVVKGNKGKNAPKAEAASL